MTPRARLGEFEMVVLAAVLRCGNYAYGVPILEEIARTIDREVSAGTLYRTLRRLERKGYVSSEVGDATPVRGGRAKTYYRVDSAGVRALHTSVRDLNTMVETLDLEAMTS